jgi:hypothetical protein
MAAATAATIDARSVLCNDDDDVSTFSDTGGEEGR